MNPTTKANAKKMRTNGFSIKEIAKCLGVTATELSVELTGVVVRKPKKQWVEKPLHEHAAELIAERPNDPEWRRVVLLNFKEPKQ